MKAPLRFYLIEDEVLLQMQLEMMLEDMGHRVTGTATSLAEALDSLDGEADLAFVDVHLADGPFGVDVARTLSERGVPVLFMTANPKRIPEDFAGALGVIVKPYSAGGIMAAVDWFQDWRRGVDRPAPSSVALPLKGEEKPPEGG